MRTKRTSGNALILFMAIMAAALFAPGMVKAGSLEPTAVPGPTMHTLDELYHKLSEIQGQNINIMKNAGMARFVDNGDGTVTDRWTSLIWLQNANPSWYKKWTDTAGTVIVIFLLLVEISPHPADTRTDNTSGTVRIECNSG